MKRRYIILILCALSVGLARRAAVEVSEANQKLNLARTQLQLLTAGEAEQDAELERRRDEIRELTIARDLKEGEVRHALASAPRTSSLWTVPPAELPAWEPGSPYIWAPKEALKRFDIGILNQQGRVTPAFKELMALDDPQVKQLNAAAQTILDQVKELELQNAYLTNSHLPGVRQEGPPALTLHVPAFSQATEGAKELFEQTLLDILGPQRTDIAQESASKWIAEQTSNFGAEAQTITVHRQQERFFYIARRSAAGWISLGASTLEPHVPSHLLPFFEPVLAQSQDEFSGQASPR